MINFQQTSQLNFRMAAKSFKKGSANLQVEAFIAIYCKKISLSKLAYVSTSDNMIWSIRRTIDALIILSDENYRFYLTPSGMKKMLIVK